MTARFAVILVVATAAQARADRERGFMMDVLGGMGLFVGSAPTEQPWVGPAIEGGIGLAYLFGDSVALGAELDTGGTRTAGRNHARTDVLVTAAIWATDHVSLDLGAGTPVGPNTRTLGGGVAGFVRVGYDVIRWRRSALIVRFGLDGDNTPGTAGLQTSITIGVDIYGLGTHIDLSK